MIVSKSCVIFSCLLILNVTLKSTQAMPTDVEPREYEDDGDEDLNFLKSELDLLGEELEDDYLETNEIENPEYEETDDTEDKVDDDLTSSASDEDDATADEEDPIELEVVFGDVEKEDDGVEEDPSDVLGGDEDGPGRVLDEEEIEEDQADEEEEGEIEKDVREEIGEDEGPVDEGHSEVIEEDGEDEVHIDESGEDEEAKDQVDEDLDEVGESEGGDNNDGESEEFQGNVFHLGNLPVEVDEEEFKHKKFPYTWLDKVKKYYKKARYYLGI